MHFWQMNFQSAKKIQVNNNADVRFNNSEVLGITVADEIMSRSPDEELWPWALHR